VRERDGGTETRDLRQACPVLGITAGKDSEATGHPGTVSNVCSSRKGERRAKGYWTGEARYGRPRASNDQPASSP